MDAARPPRRCSISTASPCRSTASGRSTSCRFMVEPGEMRAIIGPNGAGKTTMMDVVTGKTRPDAGDVYFDGAVRSDRARRDRDRRARHRPQIPEADRVRDAHGRGQSRAGAEGRPRALRDAVLARASRRAGDAHRRACSSASGSQPLRGRVAGSLSHGQKQWLEIGMLLAQEPEAAAGRRAGRRHDRRRDRADRRAAEGDQPRPQPWSWSSTTWPSCASSASRSPACTKARCWPKAPSTRCRTNERVVEVYLGRLSAGCCDVEQPSISTTARRRRCAASR